MKLHAQPIRKSGLFFAGLLLASPALAQPDQFDDSGFYLGAGYGLVSLESEDFDDDNDAAHLFAGYQILPFLGVEAGYHDFGDYGNPVYRADIESYSLAVTGQIPISNAIAVIGRLGPMWTETQFNAGGFRVDADTEEVFIGAGLAFEVAEDIDLRLTYDWIDNDLDANDLEGIGNGSFNSDLDMLSASIKFQF